MKRLSSDSLTPLCPSAPHGEDKVTYGMVFPSMIDGMDDNGCGDDDLELCSTGHEAAVVKKRRLSSDQVRALEKNFEVENKLDPERKVRLAHELGLQPRQVAVWFQNRRARWKTKNLERGYAALKASYDALRLDVDALAHDKQTLLVEIKELKTKLGDEESISSVKEELVMLNSDIKDSAVEVEAPPLIYKDGPSDSDSSGAVLNLDNSNATAPFMDSRFLKGFSFQHHQFLKAEEEHDFDDPCSTSFFAEDQEAPTLLPWCYSEHWNWDVGRGGHNNIVRQEGPF